MSHIDYRNLFKVILVNSLVLQPTIRYVLDSVQELGGMDGQQPGSSGWK